MLKNQEEKEKHLPRGGAGEGDDAAPTAPCKGVTITSEEKHVKGRGRNHSPGGVCPDRTV